MKGAYYISMFLMLCIFIIERSPHAHAQEASDCTISMELAAEDAGDLNKAIVIATCLHSKNPNDWKTDNVLAGLYGKQRNAAAEIAWAKRAVDLAPESPQPWVNYGNGFALAGRFKDAANAFSKAMALDPKSPLGSYSLAVLAEQEHRPEVAESLYRKALAINPDFEDANVSLAALLANERRGAEAIILLEHVLALNPKAADAASMLASIRKSQPN